MLYFGVKSSTKQNIDSCGLMNHLGATSGEMVKTFGTGKYLQNNGKDFTQK
jgi:hypothetical protein